LTGAAELAAARLVQVPRLGFRPYHGGDDGVADTCGG
jgi:hypothetical protein